MKIGHLENQSVTQAPGERKSGPAMPSAASGAKSAEPSAKVELSTTAAQLAAGATEGVFDAQKVQRISDAIRDGKFQVDPGAIADKLIVNAQELLSNVTRR